MLGGVLVVAPAWARAAQTSGAALAEDVCATCHGPHGRSESPAFPKLAGQQAAYIEAQLKAFRDHSRGDPMAQAFMWGMASQLDDATIARLAAYFAAQAPSAGAPGDPAEVAAGRDIYTAGIPAEHVVACVTCHLDAGQGQKTIPRVAGQHREYLVKQLALFKSELRADSLAPVMHTNIQSMTFDQMQAVAAYAASR